MRLYDPSEMKTHILSEYNQIIVFATYLNINKDEIEYCLSNKGNKINNPLRIDQNPSLGFMWVSDRDTGCAKIRMYDFANYLYRGDCFDLVGWKLRLNPNDKNDFITICKDIIYTMEETDISRTVSNTANIAVKSTRSIKLDIRPWSVMDINVWRNFGFHISEINNHIYPVQNAYVDHEIIYSNYLNDPCYAYVVGFHNFITIYKLYFPLRERSKPLPRFITNNNQYQLEDMHNLKPADILIITKSYKDKLQLKKIVSQIKSKHKIEVTNFSSESIVLNEQLVNGLKQLYKVIVTNVDFDRQGIVTSGIHKRKYGFDRFMFTNGRYNTPVFKGKDVCEIVHNMGFQVARNATQQVINHLTTKYF